MSNSFVLEAELRKDQGKGASRRLRREENKVPAILYGGEGKAPLNLSLAHNKLLRALQEEGFYTQMIKLKINGKTETAVLKDLQRHPAKQEVLHADFLRVDKHHAIHVHVPLHFINEESAIGVKTQGGKISHQIVEVEVIALPGDIPEFIEVDMANVEIETILHLSDIKLPEGVQLAALLQGDDHDLPVASIHKIKGVAAEDEEEGESEGEAE
jgi:large subunit ribosomal protein L25